jgi:CRISPR-associated protein Csd1
VRQVLTALRAPREEKQPSKEGPRFSEVEPELTRLLIRTMFQGTPPPKALLTRALRALRLPATAKGDAFGRLLDRRTALIAAIKLVLTHNNEITSETMTKLHTDNDAQCAYKCESPYLCGRTLALLNTIQHRASSSGRGVNTTLVDKFYAAASTAPQSVFGRLLSIASSAHLPKLRKDSAKDFHTLSDGTRIRLSEMLTEVVNLLNDACGPKRQHKTREQGAFALGFYHQQAVLQHPKTPTVSNITKSESSH